MAKEGALNAGAHFGQQWGDPAVQAAPINHPPGGMSYPTAGVLPMAPAQIRCSAPNENLQANATIAPPQTPSIHVNSFLSI